MRFQQPFGYLFGQPGFYIQHLEPSHLIFACELLFFLIHKAVDRCLEDFLRGVYE